MPKVLVLTLLAVTVLGAAVWQSSVTPALAAAAKPAPVLSISDSSPRVGQVVTISNTGTCAFGSCSDNLKWFPVPMSGSHFGTQIATVRFPATAVRYSWNTPGNKQIILTSRDGQSRLCCSGSTSMVITVAPTTPSAPTIGAATGGNRAASVSFTAPASTGGSAITGYTVTASPGGATASGSTGPITVDGLSNGTLYTFTVHATNAVGNSGESAASNAVKPSAVPRPPVIGTATAGNASASVSFTAPSSSGGSAITGYTVTASPGSATGSGGSSPITVTGLTNGTTYKFTVHATNALGNSLESASSNPATPATVPDAPTSASAARGDGYAFVSFTAPSSNGGSPITSYTATATPGGASVTGTTSPMTVNGLSNGTTYTFTVHATNAVGDGAESATSNAVTPATLPTAPTIGSATAGTASASVSFSAPSSNGGSPITSYTATASPGGASGTGTASPITVSGLAGGTAYTFTVHATNGVGSGPESAASNAVSPIGEPTISVGNVNVTETDGPSTAVFTVTLSAPATAAVSVRYSTSNSTATAPDDYSAASGIISFAIGQRTKTVSVAITGDNVSEPIERFFMNLSNPSGATIEDSRGNGNITDDDPAP